MGGPLNKSVPFADAPFSNATGPAAIWVTIHATAREDPWVVQDG